MFIAAEDADLVWSGLPARSIATSRKVIEQQIHGVSARGQQQFRNTLCKRYGPQCVVTGCNVLAILEAAHIKPYRGKNDHNPENGLLLRADIHTLFDLNLLGIEPKTLKVELHPALRKEYGPLVNKLLCTPPHSPAQNVLNVRYADFEKRCKLPLAKRVRRCEPPRA